MRLLRPWIRGRAFLRFGDRTSWCQRLLLLLLFQDTAQGQARRARSTAIGFYFVVGSQYPESNIQTPNLIESNGSGVAVLGFLVFSFSPLLLLLLPPFVASSASLAFSSVSLASSSASSASVSASHPVLLKHFQKGPIQAINTKSASSFDHDSSMVVVVVVLVLVLGANLGAQTEMHDLH